MDDRKLIDEIKKLVSQKDMIPGFFNGTTFTSDTRTKYTNLVLTSYNPGKAFIVKYQDKWLCVVSASNELIRTNIITDRRNRYVEPVVKVANIKILFSQIENNQSVVYVLDKESKSKVLGIDINVDNDSLQGNLFNYGDESNYTSSLRYRLLSATDFFGSSNLIALNIVGDTTYPLWDYTQIGRFDTPTYHGSAIIVSKYISTPTKMVNEQTVTTFSGIDRQRDTIKRIVYTYETELITPSIYSTLIGNHKTTIESVFNAHTPTEQGFTGYMAIYYNGLTTLRLNTKSFYTDEKTTNQFDYFTSVDTLETYSYSPLITQFATERVTNRFINENRTTTGKNYLGKYVKKEVSDTYTLEEDSQYHLTYEEFSYSGSFETLDTFILTSTLNTNVLLIEGIKSSITCHVDYMYTYTSDGITNITSNVPVDNCVYYFNSDNAPLVLNRTTAVVITNFGTTIVDEKTTKVINRTYDSLLPYIGQTFSYAQYIDADNCWLAKGTLTSNKPFTIITLTEITKVPFVSYATVNGTAITDNGSLFSLLNVLNNVSNIITTYILDLEINSYYRRAFEQFVKYACLIGDKFYVCQNNDAVKTTKTDLYVEQWDIGDNGDITRNNELIKLSVNSLDNPDSIIHSIQYWDTK